VLALSVAFLCRPDAARALHEPLPNVFAENLKQVAANDVELSLASLQSCFPYTFDAVQKRALQGLLANRSVVLSAPTGSGKTLVAEAAIVAALSAGKRAFYTTPLKALSNQKLREFRERFGCGFGALRFWCHLC